MVRYAPVGTATTIIASLLAALLLGTLQVASAGPAPVGVDQGADWTSARRDEFYSLDQGSRIIPIRWIMALKLPDGSPFMVDSLQRYGFLPNDANPAKLPVGFTTAGQAGNEFFGMTCAACHTRQIEFAGKAYRIDGGPAIIDFQTFLSDLDAAVGAVLKDDTVFSDFARAVLGTHQPADETALRKALSDWHYRYHTLMHRALPSNPWGPGRVDAVGMIFNRLTGLDLGPPPNFIIESNIKTADAPVRYPFLWNAASQDKTQWPGFAFNGEEFFTLLRNIGQVFGVFAEFHPKKDPSKEFGVNFWADNSINIGGLKRLETLMTNIGPPRWPWQLNELLAEQGKEIYRVQCGQCHNADPGAPLWTTPIEDVNTDFRELDLMERKADSGELEGVEISLLGIGPLPKVDASALDILKVSVVGTAAGSPTAKSSDSTKLRRTFRADKRGYEARVLHGVWAAAPYLHNGSVPTLTELLKPAAERTASFKIGPAYDPTAVGLAVQQTRFSATLTTTDCSDRGSGNSRCGHEYGTTLTAPEKRALLEYLKKL
jgi:RoxA-like, cytochrome c-like